MDFTVGTDGRLPTGDSLADAIETVDAATDRAPAYFMINCDRFPIRLLLLAEEEVELVDALDDTILGHCPRSDANQLLAAIPYLVDRKRFTASASDKAWLWASSQLNHQQCHAGASLLSNTCKEASAVRSCPAM